MARKLTLEELLRRFHEVHGNRYGYGEFIYNGTDVPSVIMCYQHGEFLRSAEKHLLGQGCRECGIIMRGLKLRKSDAQFILEANEVHNNRYYLHSYLLLKYNEVYRKFIPMSIKK